MTRDTRDGNLSRSHLQEVIGRTLAGMPADVRERVNAVLARTPEQIAADNEAARQAEVRRSPEYWQELRRRSCGLHGDQFKNTFATFAFAGSPAERETQAVSIRAARKFAEEWPHVKRGLIFWSRGYGNGKDHLLHAIINRLLGRQGNWDVRYWFSLDIDRDLRREWEVHSDPDTRTERLMSECDLLLIGDLHICCNTGHWASSRDVFTRVLNKAETVGKPIVCATSNVSPQEFEHECGGMLGSRSADIFDWHEIQGPDRRRKH